MGRSHKQSYFFESRLTRDMGQDESDLMSGRISRKKYNERMEARARGGFAGLEALAIVSGATALVRLSARVLMHSSIRFAQQGVSSAFRHGEFAGRTIADVAAGLRSGTISPNQLPINVVTRNGIDYAMNNRSLMALRQADMAPTVIRNVTGHSMFEAQLTTRLAEIGKVGRNYVPPIRGGGW
jgi:hypothetical protein